MKTLDSQSAALKAGPPFYVDPAGPAWAAPNLVSGLMASPTTEALAPLERQATIVLAWLLHHSSVFSRALVRCFLAEDDALAAVEAPLERIGARAWGTLRPIAGVTKKSIYPDLSIAGSGRSFELLVEIKVGAGTHSWDVGDGSKLSQPDAYLRSWLENYDESRRSADPSGRDAHTQWS